VLVCEYKTRHTKRSSQENRLILSKTTKSEEPNYDIGPSLRIYLQANRQAFSVWWHLRCNEYRVFSVIIQSYIDESCSDIDASKSEVLIDSRGYREMTNQSARQTAAYLILERFFIEKKCYFVDINGVKYNILKDKTQYDTETLKQKKFLEKLEFIFTTEALVIVYTLLSSTEDNKNGCPFNMVGQLMGQPYKETSIPKSINSGKSFWTVTYDDHSKRWKIKINEDLELLEGIKNALLGTTV